MIAESLLENALLYLALVLGLGIVSQWMAWRLKVPSILLLLAVGFGFGQLAPGVSDGVLGELLFPVVSLSVAVILFEGGMTLRLSELKEAGSSVLRLVTLGVLVSWGLSAGAAIWLLGWDPRIAALTGAVLVVTGPTVIAPLLRHVRPERRIASVLKWEGIVIDPIGAILAVLVFEVIAIGSANQAITTTIMTLGSAILLSGAVALIASVVLVQILKRYWIPDHLHSPLFLASALLLFAIPNMLVPESGLLTVTLLGVMLANQKQVPIKHVMHFKETLQVLLISCLFVVLASRVSLGDLTQLGWQGVAFVAVLILIVRPASVGIAMWGSALSKRERVFLAFLAPRGIVAAAVATLFALEVLHTFAADSAVAASAAEMVPLTFLVIVGTVAFYGLTAAPLARWLGLATANAQGVLFAGCDRWVRPIAKVLLDEGFPVMMVDTNYDSSSAARMAGLPSVCASVISEYVTEELDLSGIGRLVAMTPSDEVNTLATMEFGHIFGRASVFQLASWDAGSGRRESVSAHLRGRPLFGEDVTHNSLAQRLERGQQFKRTKLSAEFDIESFRAMYGPSALVMFVINGQRDLTIVSTDDSLTFRPGDTLIALVDVPDEPEASRQEQAG